MIAQFHPFSAVSLLNVFRHFYSYLQRIATAVYPLKSKTDQNLKHKWKYFINVIIISFQI